MKADESPLQTPSSAKQPWYALRLNPSYCQLYGGKSAGIIRVQEMQFGLAGMVAQEHLFPGISSYLRVEDSSIQLLYHLDDSERRTDGGPAFLHY